MKSEIQSGTYQALQDATLYQRTAIEKYVHLLTIRADLIADHESISGASQLVQALQEELTSDVSNVKVGFADANGNLLYGDLGTTQVKNEEWFIRGMQGETLMTVTNQNGKTNQQNLIVSTRAETVGGANGVLFAEVDGQNISGLIETHAFENQAYSLICDSDGNIVFSELKPAIVTKDGNIYQWVNDQTLERGYTVEQLQKELGDGNPIRFRFLFENIWYYAVSDAVHTNDWYVISIVQAQTADIVQHEVSMYLLGMLFIMLLVGVSMTSQAYLHEQATIKKLERDKDLLRQSSERYQLITQLSNEVFFQIDMEGGKISFNDSFESMFGTMPPVCTIDHMDECLHMVFERDQQKFLTMINRLRAGEISACEDVRMYNSRGVVRWKRFEIYSVLDQDGHSMQLVGKIADIHRQKQSMQRLIRQADSDPLTGLLNRGALERNVKGFIAEEGLSGRHALMVMDFDNFKSVNDTLGHAKGDDLLVSFAVGMKRLFRSGDFLSRTGGDEYMVFLKNIRQDSDALDKAEALRLEMTDLSRKIMIPVSISIGIAIYDRDGKTFEKLYKSADDALYTVKKSGKNNISFFSGAALAKEESAEEEPDAEEQDDTGNQE